MGPRLFVNPAKTFLLKVLTITFSLLLITVFTKAMTAARQVRIRTRTVGDQGGGDPLLVGIHHWALEIVGNDPREPNLLVELMVMGGILSAMNIRSERNFMGFFKPEEVPARVRLDFVGSTTLSNVEIRETGDKIIRENPYYNAVGANCQAFVIRVAIAIMTAPTEGLKTRVKKVDDDGLDKVTGPAVLLPLIVVKKLWDNPWGKLNSLFG